MAQPRKPARKPTQAKKTTAPKAAKPVTEAERQAKLEAYHTLKSAGVDVPTALAKEVEGWIAEAQAQHAEVAKAEQAREEARQAQVADANINGPWYVRNCANTPFNLRLDRQTERRRLELKPRGTPGDLHPIQDEDLQDSVLRTNVSMGLIEVIPAGEAALIIDKQTTNMGRREHTPLAMLRNELGQKYEADQVKVEAEFNSQGVTVATLDPRQMQGQVPDREVAGRRSWGGLQRGQQQQQVVSGFVPTGGNPAIVSQGGMMSDNARAKAVDDLARRRGGEGPQSGLGDVKVVVEPVQHT